MTPLQSDARLARRAAAGDERAFAAIYRRYHQDLYRFCLSILGRSEDAQDALQNTMVKALRALPGERREIQLKPWLYRVAHNESIDLLRRRREGTALDTVSVAGPVEVAETVARRERLGRLLADLEALPDRQRSALVMRELSGLDYGQIAEAFESSESVARQTVYEARLNLRELEAGREMDCDLVTRLISEADGRKIRRRDIQAHLRACPDCRAFRDAIGSRRGDLAALTPLPIAAAGSILHALIGGKAAGGLGTTLGAGAGVGAGAGAGNAVTASVIVKSAATVAAVAAIGVTTADRTGLIHTGLPGGEEASREQSAPASPDGSNGGSRGATGAPSSPQTNKETGSNQADATGGRSSSEQRPAKGPGAGGKAGHKKSHPSSANPAARGELPAASQHGQETAASHGGGRAAAEAKSQGKSEAAPGKQNTVPEQAVPPAPPDTRPESTPPPGNSPDNAPAQPLQPSQKSTEPGPPESAAGQGSKEAR